MANDGGKYFTIKEWSEEDRPREKLISHGIDSLSNAELLGILINAGYKEKTAVDIAKELLKQSGDSLDALSKLSLNELRKTKGIGEARGINILAALELGKRRRRDEAFLKTNKISKADEAFEYFYPILGDLDHEEFYILMLARNNGVIAHYNVSKGGVAGTVVDAKIIFREALYKLASSIILCHNHPSGNLNPSEADISLTKKIKQAGVALDINVLDHIIITSKSYYSFADSGNM